MKNYFENSMNSRLFSKEEHDRYFKIVDNYKKIKNSFQTALGKMEESLPSLYK